MSLKRTLIGALIGGCDAGIGDSRMLRALHPYQTCVDALGPLTTPNGDISCAGSTCKLAKCDEGHHRLKTDRLQNRASKCVSNWKGLKWSKQIWRCENCADMSPLEDNQDFNKKCKYVSRSGGLFKMKVCTFTCKNGKNIQPVNKKKMTNVMCRCNVTENDGKCHWRKGRNAYDMNDDKDFSKWHCGNFDPTNTTTLKVTTTKKTTTVSTRPVAEKRIPEGLKCRVPNGPPELSGQDGSDRIIGGVEAVSNSWPWIVHLRINNSWTCGGVILSDKTIVTAAHCCDGARTAKIWTGLHRTDRWDSGEKVFWASSIHMHPDYDKQTFEHDVCILKVDDIEQGMDLANNSVADFACLPSEGQQIPEGTKCWTAGWGVTENEKRGAKALQEVDLKMFDDATCKATKLSNDFKDDSMICAGYESGGYDACQGDSGGPLICAVDGEPVLMGVTSWGYGCAVKGSPGVWAEIGHKNVLDWIYPMLD